MVQKITLKPNQDMPKQPRKWQIVTSPVSSCDTSSVFSWTELAEGSVQKHPDTDQIFVTAISPEKVTESHCYGIVLTDENWLDHFVVWERHTTGECS